MEYFVIMVLSVALAFFMSVYFYAKKHPDISVEESSNTVKEFIKDGLSLNRSEIVYNAATDMMLATNIANTIQPYVKNTLEAGCWRSGYYTKNVPCVGYEMIVQNENDFPVIKALTENIFQRQLAGMGQVGVSKVEINKLSPTNYMLCIIYAVSKEQLCAYNKLMSLRQAYIQKTLAAQVSPPVDEELEKEISDSSRQG